MTDSLGTNSLGGANRIVIYTPVYSTSPGTRYRVDRMAESLKFFGCDVKVVVGREEGFVREIYGRFSASLLTRPKVWSIVGRRVAERIAKYKPEVAITITDVTAGAARHLKRKGVRTLVSVEDLSTEYSPSLRRNPRSKSLVEKILSDELGHADEIITSAHTLTRHIEGSMGLQATTIPIGLQREVDLASADKRPKIWALHSRSVVEPRQAEVISRIASELKGRGVGVLAHKSGKYARLVKDAEWYNFPSADVAARFVRKAFLGIIVEFRPAFTLSSLYFHTSLLQPIYAVGDGPWVEEADLLHIPLVKSLDDTGRVSAEQISKCASSLEVPNVHEQLKRILR